MQISTQITFFANLAHSHTANGPCLHCFERRIVLMNSLIKHVSFLFSIFPLSNMVKIFPAVWKWLAGRGRELLTLLRAFSIWRKWPLLILLSNRADHPLDNQGNPTCSVTKASLDGILHEKYIYSSCYTRHHTWETHLGAGT